MLRRNRIVLAAAALIIPCVGSIANAGNYYTYGRYYNTVHQHHHATPIGVAPLRFHNPLASVPAGSSLTLPGNFLGEHPGSVFLVFGNIKLPVQVMNWSNDSVTITLPPMSVRHPIQVRLDVVLPHGQLGLQRSFMLTKPADVVLHPAGPRSPLPTSSALLQQTAPIQN
ncbi:MAG: hypothetical protein KDB27_26570 [Planctomycetales bacterium]|nr:hypothetical protein [Planctomycetales bacterium]